MATPAPEPTNEAERLCALHRLDILNSEPEPEFDRITRIAASVCNAPIAVVSLVDRNRQWFKSTVGLESRETPRDAAFCGHTILGEDVHIVPDAKRDPRCADNPLVLGPPYIVAYAGAPLIDADGHALGALCVIHHEPTVLSDEQVAILRELAGVATDALGARHRAMLLRESEQRFMLAAKGASVGIWDWFDVKGESEYWSDQFYALLGYEPGEIEPSVSSFRSLVHPNDAEATFAALDRHFEHREPFRVEYRLRHKERGYRWFVGAGQAVWNDDGAPQRMIGSIMGVHDLKTAQRQAEAANVAKSAFLASMSHEIRTPMNGVLGMAAALNNTTLTSKQRTMIDVITASGDALLTIINDLLDLSKIEAGKLELELVEFDLADVVSSTIAPHALAAEKKGLVFQVADPDRSQERFFGDPTRLRQILDNLLSNAIKFTEHGGVSVAFEHRASPGGGAEFHFAVADTGIGISPDYATQLFSAFVQEDASITRKFGGTGLGLAIARQLVESMGGNISVESVKGRGSTFHFHICVEPVSSSAPAVAPDIPDAATDGAAGTAVVRILSAEDNEKNRLVLEALLDCDRYDLTSVENGRLAVEAWTSGSYDLVLMDIRMPVMDGVAATREIRAIEAREALAPTPIVALTANALPDQLASYLVAGMDACVAKPINPRVLLEAIETAAAPVETGKARAVGA